MTHVILKMRRRATLLLSLGFSLPLFGYPSLAEEFYLGKRITLSTHTGPGGGYDTYLRLLARHIGKHIPGEPATLVVNQPGAGGLLALNFAAKRAAQDGTFLTMVSQGLYLHEALGKPGIERSLKTFNFIGNLNSSNNVTATWHLSGVKTIQDAMKREVTVGSTGAGAITTTVPIVMNAILGTKFKVIFGYRGGAAQDLAMQRGEIDGRSVNTWDGYKALMPQAIKAGHLHVLVQIAMKREPDLPGVPLLTDLVKDDPRKRAIAEFLSKGMSISRSIAAPPGVPDARVEILRRAFIASTTDPAFVAEATKLNVEISADPGEHVQQVVMDVIDAPAELRKDVAKAAKM